MYVCMYVCIDCSTNVRKNMEGSGLWGPRADIRLEVQFFSR